MDGVRLYPTVRIEAIFLLYLVVKNQVLHFFYVMGKLSYGSPDGFFMR